MGKNYETKSFGRLTLPGEENFYDETIELIKRLGADAIRDSDGTNLPDDVKSIEGVTIYSKYLTARGEDKNDFASCYPIEMSRFYLLSDFVTATSDKTEINFTRDYYSEQIRPDYDHDPYKWWEVIDRTTKEIVPVDKWEIDKDRNVAIIKTVPFHEYTVTFLAYGIWDPVHMYNHITNNWGDDVAHDIPFDARYPQSSKFVEEHFEEFLKDNPKSDVIRFTTFFYQFSLIFNRKGLEKHVDWYGYTNSISPLAMEEFEKEYGYKLRPEDIVDAGYYNSTFRIPSKAFMDYIDFQQKFVSQKAKRMVDLVHKYGKKAIMFLGDHWIGTEPFGKYFKDIGLDGVVGSVGDGVTLRLISDIDTPMTEGRFLPYFFPDTFYDGNNPTIEAKDNWIKARRALIRKPLDRIGYGGYMSLAYKFPEFINYIEKVANEFRDLYETVSKDKALTKARVAILNAWGSLRKWAPWIVAHGKWYKLSYSYMGITEALSGMDVEVEFIDFDDVKNGIDPGIDVIINAGDAYTAFSGGYNFSDPEVVSNLRKFVFEGGGLIGVGEPSAFDMENGRFFQLADVFGVDKEIGYSQSNNKYFTTVISPHFITEDITEAQDFGESVKNIYSTNETTEILEYSNNEVHMAVNDYGKGRAFYISGLPYSKQNTRILKRAIHFVSHKEEELKKYFADDIRIEVAAFPNLNKYCVFNNSLDEVTTNIYDGDGNCKEISIEGADLIWFEE